MQGPMGSTMSMPLLPPWARAAWAIALVGVAVVHIWHAWAMRGQTRWWHAQHTAMAAGMIVMYLAGGMIGSGPALAGTVLFGALTVAVAATATLLRRREGVLNALWVPRRWTCWR
jgi:hypothetical protein